MCGKRKRKHGGKQGTMTSTHLAMDQLVRIGKFQRHGRSEDIPSSMSRLSRLSRSTSLPDLSGRNCPGIGNLSYYSSGLCLAPRALRKTIPRKALICSDRCRLLLICRHFISDGCSLCRQTPISDASCDTEPSVPKKVRSLHHTD